MAKKAASTGIEDFINDGLVMRASDSTLDIVRCPTGVPALDAEDMLNGGLVFGRNYLITGPESTGKTLLCQYAAAAVQRYDAETMVLFVDMERSFDRDWWQASGVDLDRLLISQPATGEKAVDVVSAALKSSGFKLIIIDSLAAMTPKARVEAQSVEDSTRMAALANVVSMLYQTLGAHNKSCVFIATNQLRDNIGGYDDQYPGGRSQRFYSHVILRTRRSQWIGDERERQGYILEVLNKKNKLGGVQTSTCELSVRFGSQIDLFASYIDEAMDKGIVKRAGPYYKWDDVQTLGKDAFRLHLEENPDALERLKEQLDAVSRDES